MLLHRRVLTAALAVVCVAAQAQDKVRPVLPAVTVTARANPDPVEKSYRKMVRAMDLFERLRGMAPGAALRFKLLPRRPETDMTRIDLAVVGSSVEFAVPVAPDHSFSLQRNQQAFAEDAQVTPNRRAQSMTWRTDIRTPGLPPNTRRLGDLRLECQVGMEAGLVSNSRTVIGRVVELFLDTPAYCERKSQRYLFFSDRPLFGVTLVAGQRREMLAIDKLYAGAIAIGSATQADVMAALGPAAVIRFDSGHEVWVYRGKSPEATAAKAELVVLFAPTGIAKKTRIRPAYAEQAQ